MCDATREASEIRAEFRMMFDPGDTWGCVMSALFDIAETLYAWDAGPPAAWEFRPGLGEPEVAEWLEDYDEDTLADFGNALNRWADMLRARGDSY